MLIFKQLTRDTFINNANNLKTVHSFFKEAFSNWGFIDR